MVDARDHWMVLLMVALKVVVKDALVAETKDKVMAVRSE